MNHTWHNITAIFNAQSGEADAVKEASSNLSGKKNETVEKKKKKNPE